VTTSIAIDVDEEAGTALSRAYFTVLQAPPGLPRQPVPAGRYRDRFTRSGADWRFTEHAVRAGLAGDLSQHLRGSSQAGGSCPEPPE
jgi:hypothetical protein